MSSSSSQDTRNMLRFLGKREFTDVIKVKNLEMGRLRCIIQVGPIQSHESLKQRTGMREQVNVGRPERWWWEKCPMLRYYAEVQESSR